MNLLLRKSFMKEGGRRKIRKKHKWRWWGKEGQKGRWIIEGLGLR